jgi:hypothetical protein
MPHAVKAPADATLPVDAHRCAGETREAVAQLRGGSQYRRPMTKVKVVDTRVHDGPECNNIRVLLHDEQ